MKYEPARLEIFLTRLTFSLFGRTIYKTFSDRLPISGDEQVLDFGCGMGTVAYYAAKKLPQGQLTCLDISSRRLKACRKTLRKFTNVKFMQWDSEPLEKECFDLVYCHFVLHDIPEPELEKTIPMLAESLKPGGLLIFREPLNETGKISAIKRLINQSKLSLSDSRITDVPMMGNTLESIYFKK